MWKSPVLMVTQTGPEMWKVRTEIRLVPVSTERLQLTPTPARVFFMKNSYTKFHQIRQRL